MSNVAEILAFLSPAKHKLSKSDRHNKIICFPAFATAEVQWFEALILEVKELYYDL